MNGEDWERLKPLFEQAIELGSAERADFIRQITAHDEALGRKLADLVEAHFRTDPIPQPPSGPEPAPGGDRCFADGEILLGRFEIVRFIAHGGMGEVYEARDSRLGQVALKTIRTDSFGAARMLERFHREIHLSRRVTDGHVCRVHDLFTVPPQGGRGPVDFLTMEYIEGQTLASRIKDGLLPLDEARGIALQICAGLAAIHQAGIVHRDLTSRNVMVTAGASRSGSTEIRVKIMDLGLACDANPDVSAEITDRHALMGTLQYMAPEQFGGTPAGGATDIYALGVLLYEMTTGELPFPSRNAVSAAIERAKKAAPPSSLRPEIPWQWDAVILRCLEVDPEHRFRSAAEVADELAGPAEQAPARRPVWRSSLAAAAGMLALVLIAVTAWYLRPYPTPPPQAEFWYERGLEALREGTYHKATTEFSQAISLYPNFLLAHARLADAWAELDYVGKAKDEMLKASGLESKQRVRPLDAKYVDAVRSALTFEYATSLKEYREILNDLPASEKAYGYVDVGRAYQKAADTARSPDERSGDIAKALGSYKAGARLAPEYPASFVRLGVLEARQAHQLAADAAFSRAKYLYAAASDVEGQAEVDWQRAYALGLAGKYKEADQLLEDVLDKSRHIHSPQLEVRTLLRMSTDAYNSDDYVKSADLAGRAIDLAREKGLDYWVIDGLVRLGNAWLSIDWKKAEDPLRRALTLAQESQRPRLEAAAKLSLAIIRDQQSRPDECLALAQPAFDYYSRAGFAVDAMTASLLMTRSERNKGDFKSALQHALEGRDLAQSYANDPYILRFEELAGSTLLELQRFSDSLPHFEAALRVAEKLNASVANEKVFAAEALLRLAHFDESQAMLQSIPPDAAAQPRMAVAIDRVRALTSLTRLDFPRVLENARRGLAIQSTVSDDVKGEFQVLIAESAVAAGKSGEAESACRIAADAAASSSDPDLAARANLCLARASLAAHAPQRAMDQAEAAVRFFAGTGQLESQSFALLALAKACRDSGDKSRAHEFALKALDMLGTSQHNQGSPGGDFYARRPDIAAARDELLQLSRD